MIKSLLIANRGEIACRVMRSAQKMGITTVAVYSDADAEALHVRMADKAVHIGPPAANESYLLGDKIIKAAKDTGADAIHPGYGFLSENAEFAQKVIDAGLIWVGPKPDSIRAMGLKDAAKTLMDEAGVPTTPGYLGDDQRPEFLAEQAGKIGYPVLIKAVAGGGGKGMRKVDAEADFADALLSCQREAKASFGNDIVLIEKFIESPRHIEVQIFGDSHGNVVHLFERDCTLQRRHQKVVEEAPAPGMDEATRKAVCDAAVRAGQAVNYEGAGTIEFIADGSGKLDADKIWFMEMNTRLQVEHPVTEEITGVDLVEWQIRVAAGEVIPKKQDELAINGHAVEIRVYAEDPLTGFLPSIGRLDHLRLPFDARVETGVEEGDAVSPFYDPMIAKVIVHEDNRDDAIAAMIDAVKETQIWPVKTNIGFLLKALDAEDFRNGSMTTGFIAAAGDALMPPSAASEGAWMLAAELREQIDGSLENNILSMPHSQLGFRLNAPAQSKVALEQGGEVRSIGYFDGENTPHDGDMDWAKSGANIVVFEGGQAFAFGLPRSTGAGTASDGALLSPMPGKIIAVDVAMGDKVTKGQKLVTLEAMKMEHSLSAPFDGVVSSLAATIGDQVADGIVLAEIEKAE